MLKFLRGGANVERTLYLIWGNGMRSIALCVLIALSLVGCSGGGGSGGGEASIASIPSINLSELLPEEWKFTEYHEINIDENPQWVERLILFRYSQPTGSISVSPIGATIYDSQYDGRLQTGEDELMPNQPSGILVPYRLLPSYWPGTGQGFIAQSNEAVTLDLVNRLNISEFARAVKRLTPTPEPIFAESEIVPTSTPAPRIPPADELIIWGGNNLVTTRMTVVWWKSIYDGYGFTQVYAPGGLYDIHWETDGIAGNNPVRWLRGSWPRNERSMLCYDTRYTRTLSPVNDDDHWQRSIQYVATSLGLVFCHGTPAHPFYPEGVVLAYLLDPENSVHLLGDGQGAQYQKTLGARNTYYVDNILAYPIVDTQEPIETAVCVELMKSSGTPLPARLAPYQDDEYPIFYQVERQIFNFNLRYDEPEFESNRSSDRLKIMNMSFIDSPSPDHPINNCAHYIQSN